MSTACCGPVTDKSHKSTLINRSESSVHVISSFIFTYIDNYNNEDVCDDDNNSSKSLGLSVIGDRQLCQPTQMS